MKLKELNGVKMELMELKSKFKKMEKADSFV